MVKPEVLAWRGVVLGWRKTTKALPCSPDFRFHVDSDWSGKMLMMHWWHKNGRCYLTSYCKNWVTLKVNAMGEERIAVTLSHSPQELIAGISVMRKNVIVCKREGKSGHRIKINLPPCSLTFKVCGGERDEGARWWRMALRIPNWLRAWSQPGMEACPFQNLQVHLKGMADSVCTGVQPLCIPSCTPACSCCRQQQDHLSLALSLTQREPSPLSSGKENMGFLPFLCYPPIHLSTFLSLHIFLLKLTPLLPGEQQPGTTEDETVTLSPPSFFFSPLDSLLWPEWHPLFAFSPWFSALGDRLWAGSKCWGRAKTARGGCCYPTACHSGRWWRGLMWIAPVSLIEGTLQLCYVLDCTWLMPFFCRLQAGHSCFFKENFVFLGRNKAPMTILYPHIQYYTP